MALQLPTHVLIVEDEMLVRWQIRESLEQIGIVQICEASNAIDAKDILKEKDCDFIFMDINLGNGQDGISLSREILLEKHIPIVFVTAYTDDDVFEETLDLFPYGFLGKPFVSKDIRRSLQIGYNRYLQEREDKNKRKSTDHVLYLENAYHYDLKNHILYKENQRIMLKGKTSLFIDLLCQNPYSIMTYDVLIEQIWGEDASLSSLRTLVYDIRKKMDDFPLLTHSKIGYSLLSK